MLRAVERHVLKEVREAALAVFFLYRAYTLRDIEIGDFLRVAVVAYVIRQSVVGIGGIICACAAMAMVTKSSVRIFFIFIFVVFVGYSVIVEFAFFL